MRISVPVILGIRESTGPDLVFSNIVGFIKQLRSAIQLSIKDG
jgi:hypothetical protein